MVRWTVVEWLVALGLVAMAVACARQVVGPVPPVSPGAPNAPGVPAAPPSAAIEARVSWAGAPPPSRIRIARIGLSATVVPLPPAPDMGVPVPADPGVAGWDAAGPSPGDPGPAVVLGHLDAADGPAVFWNLARLRPGDDVVVDRADGSSARFRVDRIERFARASFPSGEVYGATASPELRLITCGGAFDRPTGEYRDNVVVFATLV
jgi:hypothetical protein